MRGITFRSEPATTAFSLAPCHHRYFPNSVPHAAHSIYFQVLGEQGWPALVLYLLILTLSLRNTFIVARQTRNQPGLAWAHDLASMIFVSLLAFCVGGAALSLAYFDGYLVLLALTSTLRELTTPSRVAVIPPLWQRRYTRPPDGG